MKSLFSRTRPSPRYLELLEQYRLMHTEGEQFRQIPAAETFSGQSLPRHATKVKKLIDAFGAKSILDYGAGKGRQYTSFKVKLPDGSEYSTIPAYWGIDRLVCYDPGYEPFSKLPAAQCDGVISTDVLEHCPEEDVPWIVSELFAFARMFVMANVACYPARKRLANGENAHCTVKDLAWWEGVLNEIGPTYPQVRYWFLLDHITADERGTSSLETVVIQG